MNMKEQLEIQALYSVKSVKSDEPKGSDVPRAQATKKRGRPPKAKAD